MLITASIADRPLGQHDCCPHLTLHSKGAVKSLLRVRAIRTSTDPLVYRRPCSWNTGPLCTTRCGLVTGVLVLAVYCVIPKLLQRGPCMQHGHCCSLNAGTGAASLLPEMRGNNFGTVHACRACSAGMSYGKRGKAKRSLESSGRRQSGPKPRTEPTYTHMPHNKRVTRRP